MRDYDTYLLSEILERHGPMKIERMGEFQYQRCDFCANPMAHFILKALRAPSLEVFACLLCPVAQMMTGKEDYQKLLFDKVRSRGGLLKQHEVQRAKREAALRPFPVPDKDEESIDYVTYSGKKTNIIIPKF